MEIDSSSAPSKPNYLSGGSGNFSSTPNEVNDVSSGAEAGYEACAGASSEPEVNDRIEELAGQAGRDGQTEEYAQGLALGCLERSLETPGG